LYIDKKERVWIVDIGSLFSTDLLFFSHQEVEEIYHQILPTNEEEEENQSTFIFDLRIAGEEEFEPMENPRRPLKGPTDATALFGVDFYKFRNLCEKGNPNSDSDEEGEEDD